MYFLFFLVSLAASILGTVSGVGAGVIVKPVLDATGILEVEVVTFLSGCTVLSMSVISVLTGKKIKNKNADITKFLIIGAVLGGILGKQVFQLMISNISINFVGMLQALVLTFVTLFAFLYSLFVDKIKTYNLQNKYIVIIIGLTLGIVSSFLGIGGGPINLVILRFLFSMKTKYAAKNSLFIIMFSQSASLIITILTKTVPEVSLLLFVLMVTGGILGGVVGTKLSDKFSDSAVNKSFMFMMCIIILLNIYNVYAFSIA